MGESSAVSKGCSGGGATPSSPAAIGDHVLRRRRLVVADVVDAAGRGRAIEAAQDAGDVVDVDAVEHLAGLDDAARGAVAQVVERAAAGPVDAGEAENLRPAGRSPSQATASARARRSARASVGVGRRVLVDPGAPDGRRRRRRCDEVADPGERAAARARSCGMWRSTASPSASGGIETRTWVVAVERGGGLGSGRVAVEETSAIALAPMAAAFVGPARGAAHLPALGGEAAASTLRRCSRGRSRKDAAHRGLSLPLGPHLRVASRRAAGAARNAAKLARGSRRASAHTAMARTSGEASSSRRSAAGTSAGSPELPTRSARCGRSGRARCA